MPVTYSYAFQEDLAANFREVVNSKPREQAFEGSPTLKLLLKKPKKLQGNYIHVNVSHVGTPTGGVVTEAGTLATNSVESGKVAQFEPALYAEAGRLSHLQRMKTGGSKALFNRWMFELEQARLRLMKKIAQELWTTSQTASGLFPIQVAIPADNTTGTYGLNRATYSWWRNYSATGVGAFTSNGYDAMDLASLGVQVDGGEGVDLWVTEKAIFQKMKKAARSTTNFEPHYKGKWEKRLSDFGIEAISFEGKPVIWDPYIAASTGKIFGWREDSFYLALYQDFETGPVRSLEPSGVLADIAFVSFGAQLVTEEPRRTLQLSGLS